MQEYAPAPGGGAFAQSREYYAELEAWLSREEAAGFGTRSSRSSCRRVAGSCCAGCTRITWTCWPRASSAAMA